MKHNDYRRKVDAKYWLIPPEIYDPLNAEFHFTFDPCPYPFEKDGVELDWGVVNWVNPPFKASDSCGHGINDFVRKAILEKSKGKTSVLILPVPGYVTMLLQAHAEIRPVGRVKWISAITGKPDTAPNHNALFILRSSEHIIPRPANDIFPSSR